MDRFDSIMAFKRVVEVGSFTKAAASLGLQKTTLSAQVAALERRLGLRLLNRTTRNVSLTPEGSAYYEEVTPLLGRLQDAEAAVTAIKAVPRGRLRIDMPPAVGQRIVIPALGSFLSRYPDIVLEVGCTDRPVDLVSEAIDCVLRGYLIHDEALVAKRLGSFDIATCAAPTYLALRGRPSTFADLEEHHFCRLFSSKTREYFEYNFIKNGLRLLARGASTVSFNDIDSALAGGLAGLGIVQLPLYIVHRHIEEGSLERILEDFDVEKIPINALYPRSLNLSPNVRAFVSWARELFARQEHVSTP